MSANTPTQDPRRTVTGNRIDESLAMGMAKSLIKRMAVSNSTVIKKPIDPGTERGRIRGFSAIKAEKGEGFVGMTASKGHYTGQVAEVVALRSAKGDQADELGICTSHISLQFSDVTNPVFQDDWPMSFPKLLAVIPQHLISRLIQRGGSHSIAEMMDTLKASAAWSQIGIQSQTKGAWMLPVKDGLVCGRLGVFMRDYRNAKYMQQTFARETSYLTTFIDNDRLKQSHKDARDRLIAAGALSFRPRILDRLAVSQQEAMIWQCMRQEGEAWEIRRNHAIEIEKAKAATEANCHSPDF